MLKLIGSVMVFGSCAALGLSARQNLRRRVAAADAMLLALGLIRSEISGRRTPMPEIVGLLTENEQPIVRKVFRTLQRRLREQNGLSLGYLWRSTLRDCRAQVGLGTQECDILCDAANYLGRYDADEQLTGLSQVERRLAAHQRGKGAKYTRSHLPVSLAYREAQPDKPAALRREAAIKRLSRAEKLRLISGAATETPETSK